MTPQSSSKPPALATRILGGLLPDYSREAISGDMQETFAQIEMEHGVVAARRWYWRETLAALPSFAVHSLQTAQIRRQPVNGNTWNENWFGKNSDMLARVGFVVLMPALLVISFAVKTALFGEASMASFPGGSQLIAILYSGWIEVGAVRFPVGIILLGGLMLAGVINFFAVVQLKIETIKDAYRATFTIKRKIWNLVLLGLVVLLGLGMDWLIS